MIFSSSLLPDGWLSALDQRVLLGFGGGGDARVFVGLFGLLEGCFLADLRGVGDQIIDASGMAESLLDCCSASVSPRLGSGRATFR